LVLVCFTVFGAVCSNAAAQALTLDKCLAEAAENNPDLAAAREALHKARFHYQSAYSTFLPQVSVGVSRGRSGSESAETPNDANSVGVSANQSLYNGGRDRAAVEEADAVREVTEWELRILEAQLTYSTCDAFARLLFAQESIAVTEVIAKRRQDNVNLLQLRYEGGREHKGSLLRMVAASRQADFDVVAAHRNVQVARRRLARLLGRSESDAVAEGQLEVVTPGVVTNWSALVAQTPDHRLALAQVRASKAGVVQARGRFRPSLSANASAGRGGESWPPNNDDWSVGLSMSFPVFSGGADYLNVKSAQAEQRRTEASARSKDDELAYVLEQAYADFCNATDNVKVQQNFLEAATTRAEIARSQYTSGQLSFDNWDLIENDLINAQKSHLASRRDAVIAAANWEKAQGRSRLAKGE